MARGRNILFAAQYVKLEFGLGLQPVWVLTDVMQELCIIISQVLSAI